MLESVESKVQHFDKLSDRKVQSSEFKVQGSEFKVQKNKHCLKFISLFKEKMCNFGESFIDFEKGEMSEWFKEHAWKVCILQKGIAGSNPALSAKLEMN